MTLTTVRTGGLAAACAAVLLLAGCQKAPSPELKEISVQELATQLQSKSITVYDVNTDDFRQENGKIPGAVLLASSSKYDLGLLPPDKDAPLAFYCTSRT